MIVKDLQEAVDLLIQNDFPVFPNKKLAIEQGKKFGWKDCIKIKRRFETVWVVGKKDFQPTEIAGITHDNYRFPMLKWERDNRNIQFNPVVQFQIKTY